MVLVIELLLLVVFYIGRYLSWFACTLFLALILSCTLNLQNEALRVTSLVSRGAPYPA
jgi:hypothetical protein